VEALVAEAEQDIAEGEGQLSGELALGASTTIAQYVLPRLIGAFLLENPRVRLSLQSGNTEQIVRLLLDGALPWVLSKDRRGIERCAPSRSWKTK